MPRIRAFPAAAAAAVLLAVPSLAQAADEKVTVRKQTLTLKVMVGPEGDQACDVAADLYTPSTATRRSPAPAILTTNGFGGSKDDQAPMADAFAKRGYVVLSYSGLGFGGSGCNITLDSPEWDGKAASALISFLGGQRNNGHQIDYVRRDRLAHDGVRRRFDARVGMIGGSYGGGVQFAAASVDSRLDTIIPMITWHDLAYSLTPNNRYLGTQPNTTNPGVAKLQWTELFFGVGVSQPLQHSGTTPKPPSSCPGFDPAVCPANLRTALLGYPDAETIRMLRRASVASYIHKIRIPTFLAQGQGDTLFNINEAVATYRGLKARGVPVKLVLHSWGHSRASAAPGEFDLVRPESNHEGRLVLNWFDRYLKGKRVSTGAEVEYFRDWVRYRGSAAPAYASAPSWPVGREQPLYLSAAADLVTTRAAVRPGTATFAAPASGYPASYSETSAVQERDPFARIRPFDPPGTHATFSTPPLSAAADVVGIPTLDVKLSAPASVMADPSLQPTLFVKLYDVAPDGSVTLVWRLVSPVRVDDVSKPVRVHLPGIVHRFAKGHLLQLVVATTDQAYQASRAPHVVQIVNDPNAPNVLRLPVTSPVRVAS